MLINRNYTRNKAFYSRMEMNMIKFNKGTSTSVIALLTATAFSAGPLYAQQTQDAPVSVSSISADEIIDTDMDIIYVTVDKRRSTNVNDLAMSVTAFNEYKMDRLNIVDFDDLIVHVPSTNFIDNGGPGRGSEVASIRGLSRVSDSTAPIVAQYLDGAPRFGNSYRLFDIGEVSVLRGPQGTLWGGQSLGGIVSFKSNRPDLENLGGNAEIDLYNTKGDDGLSYRIKGVVNLPLAEDKLAIRVAGQHIDESGFINNIATNDKGVNTVKDTSFRASVLFKPNENIDITAIYHRNDLESNASSFFEIGLPGRQTTDAISSQPADQRYDLLNMIIDVDLDTVALSYNGSYFNADNTFVLFDNFYGLADGYTGVRKDQKSWTHEFRVASKSDGQLNWVGGFYYDNFDETAFDDFVSQPDGDELFLYGGPSKTKEWAFFGEATYEFSNKLEILVGARYYDWQVDDVPTFLFFGSDLSDPAGTAEGNGFLFKGQINYKPNDNTLIYALRSEGFRIGGFNAGVDPSVGLGDEFAQYNPDELTNYEVGFKIQSDDNRVAFNAAAYFMDWANVQSVVSNEAGNFFITANVPDLNAWGLEAQLTATDVMIPGLYTGVTYSYNKNEFQSDASLFDNGIVNIAKGDELRRTPHHTWSFDTSYDFAVGDGIDAFVRANYWHKSSTLTFGFDGGDGNIVVPSQDVVNMSVGVTRGNIEVKLYADNLFNARPLFNVTPSGTDDTVPARASSIRPFTVGLQLRFKFGSNY